MEMPNSTASYVVTLPERLAGELKALDDTYTARLDSVLEFVARGLEEAERHGIPTTQELLLLFLGRSAHVLRGSREITLATQVTREQALGGTVEAGLQISVVDVSLAFGYRQGYRTHEAATSRLSFDWAFGNVQEHLADLLLHGGVDAQTVRELFLALLGAPDAPEPPEPPTGG
jgi:hypothetical protein